MAAKKPIEQETYSPIIFHEKIDRPPIDTWVPSEEDQVFKTVKGYVIMDVSSFYGMEHNMNLDSFDLSAKRSYNNQKLREHLVHYLNYFEKYYDYDKELQLVYASIKYMIDFEPSYTKESLFYDIKRRIIHGPLAIKAEYMVQDNYELDLEYSNKKNPSLQYTDKHAILLLKISLLMNMMIPLVCHFLAVRKINKTIDSLMEIYDDLLHIDPNIDIYAKLYETALTNVERTAKKNSVIFAKQGIRGINTTLHSINSTVNIILNLIPKYIFSQNHINLNYRSIKHEVIVLPSRNIRCRNPLNCWESLRAIMLQQKSWKETWIKCERYKKFIDWLISSQARISDLLQIIIRRSGGIGRHARFRFSCF